MITCVKVYKYIETNCYFYVDESTNIGFIIDPGANGKELIDIIQKKNLKIDKIIITHGHFDHIGAVNELHSELNIPIFAHENSDMYLKDPKYNMSDTVGDNIIINDINYLKDKDILEFPKNSDMNLKVLYTPGHTKDSCIFYNEKEKICFTGDTIFYGSIGRWDFPGGNFNEIENSIKTKVFSLPPDTSLLPGHEDITTVQREMDFGYFSKSPF